MNVYIVSYLILCIRKDVLHVDYLQDLRLCPDRPHLAQIRGIFVGGNVSVIVGLIGEAMGV